MAVRWSRKRLARTTWAAGAHGTLLLLQYLSVPQNNHAMAFPQSKAKKGQFDLAELHGFR